MNANAVEPMNAEISLSPPLRMKLRDIDNALKSLNKSTYHVVKMIVDLYNDKDFDAECGGQPHIKAEYLNGRISAFNVTVEEAVECLRAYPNEQEWTQFKGVRHMVATIQHNKAELRRKERQEQEQAFARGPKKSKRVEQLEKVVDELHEKNRELERRALSPPTSPAEPEYDDEPQQSASPPREPVERQRLVTLEDWRQECYSLRNKLIALTDEKERLQIENRRLVEKLRMIQHRVQQVV